MKKSLKKPITAMFFLSCNMAFCGTMGPVVSSANNDIKEGLYLGAGVGGSFSNYKLTASNYLTNLSVSKTSSNSNVVGNVFGGYGYTANNSLYLGGEIGTNFPRRSTTIHGRPGVSNTSTTYTDHLYIQDYVTLDVLPGYRIQPNWLAYARLGISFGQLKLYQPFTVANGVESFEASKNVVGGRFGVGVSYAVSEHFGASIDYYYSDYQKFNSTWPRYTINFNNTSSSNYVGVSVVYTV